MASESIARLIWKGTIHTTSQQRHGSVRRPQHVCCGVPGRPVDRVRVRVLYYLCDSLSLLFVNVGVRVCWHTRAHVCGLPTFFRGEGVNRPTRWLIPYHDPAVVWVCAWLPPEMPPPLPQPSLLPVVTHHCLHHLCMYKHLSRCTGFPNVMVPVAWGGAEGLASSTEIFCRPKFASAGLAMLII